VFIKAFACFVDRWECEVTPFFNIAIDDETTEEDRHNRNDDSNGDDRRSVELGRGGRGRGGQGTKIDGERIGCLKGAPPYVIIWIGRLEDHGHGVSHAGLNRGHLRVERR